jgi:hypothetical protein
MVFLYFLRKQAVRVARYHHPYQSCYLLIDINRGDFVEIVFGFVFYFLHFSTLLSMCFKIVMQSIKTKQKTLLMVSYEE